jgi:Uncharacterised protein conserved in bacteria (DUF2313)
MLGFVPVSGNPTSDAGSPTITGSATQTLAGVVQAAVVSAPAKFTQATTLGPVVQVATVVSARSYVAAQTLAGIIQAAHGNNQARATQVLNPVTQVAKAALGSYWASVSTLAGVSQTATASFVNRYFAASQTLNKVVASETFITQHYFTGAQRLAGIVQSATALATLVQADCGSGWVKPQGKATNALLRHLPEGVAWLSWRLVGKTAFSFMSALGRAYDDIWNTLCRLAEELDPRTTTEMIGEWEEALSLPDPCLPVPATLAERRARIMLRLSMRRWTTAQDWHELAALFGLTITITPGWCVQKPALYPACYPKRYDLFPRLGRFRVYIDINGVNFGGYDYGADNRGPGYPIPYGINAPQANGFMCIIDKVRPANVVVLWNLHPQDRYPCVTDCAAPSNPPYPTN